MEINLTKDAKNMLYSLYQAYKCRIKNCVPMKAAKEFMSLEKIQADLFPTWPIDDILDTILELQNAGLGRHYIRQGIILSENAIAYMENRFKSEALGVVDMISKFIP